MPPLGQRVAVYARVSTFEQDPENQLQELRRYCEARGWTAVEYVDRGVSGSKDKRPALDALLKDAKRRRFDVLVCWRLDRLGRNLRHLVTDARRPPACRRGVRQLGRGHRLHDASGQASTAYPGGTGGVRAGTHPRTSHGWSGASSLQGPKVGQTRTKRP